VIETGGRQYSVSDWISIWVAGGCQRG
jgi:hypothetical protein